MRQPDVPSLVAGMAVTLLGLLLLADRLALLDLSFRLLWPTLLAAVGAVLLASGLSGPRR
jgi:hypothetical protein